MRIKRNETKLIVENWRNLLSGGIISESDDSLDDEATRSRNQIIHDEFDEYYATYVRLVAGMVDSAEELIKDADMLSDVYGYESEYSEEFQNVYDELLEPENSSDKDSILELQELIYKACLENDKNILLGSESSGDKKFSGAKSNVITDRTRFYAYTYSNIFDTPLKYLFISEPRTMQLENNNMFKPAGIWFGKEDEWKKFCEENSFNMDDEYRFKSQIGLNLKRLAVLDSHEKREAFEADYLKGSGRMAAIDWGKVSDDYDGIIMSEEALVPSGHWSSTWDITSGCVWRASGILRIDRDRFDLEKSSNRDDYY